MPANVQEEIRQTLLANERKASEQALLLQLYRLLYSYNPDSPMGEGMKAEFLGIRAKIDELRNYVRG